ncbi:MAG TPA: glutathione S-transferase family protein [Xanthobacteraceae bacterium]|nr:glutathione S-transferase family protein [Xanthobacteraceae bacterium]
MLTLYHSQPTGNSYKVRLLLSILQIPYTAIEIDIFHGGNKSTAYRRISPLGKVPALRLEDKSILTESNAILSYLASETEYFPSDPLLRARVLQWMFFEQYSHLPYIGVARFYLHLLKKPPPRDGDLAIWHSRGNIALEIMDRHLAKRQWLATDAFTIADIALYGYTHVAAEGGFDLSKYREVQQWLTRIEGRPGYVPLMQTPPLVGRFLA